MAKRIVGNDMLRFWSKVEQNGDCLIWTGSQTQGYGQFNIRGRRWLAHRLAYQMAGNVLDDRLTLDHLCRVPLCVNPNHLEQVTRGENVLRGVGASARNRDKTHCPQGHAYDEQNTYRRPGSTHRICRACTKEWWQRNRGRYKKVRSR